MVDPAGAQEDAQTRQLRLLCAQLSGDLTEPGGMAAFQRCLTTHNPTGEIRRDNNLAPPAATAGTSLTGTTSLVHPGAALTGPPTALTGRPVALTGGTPVSLYHPVGALISVRETPGELRLTLASDILFDFGRSTIRADAKPGLDRVAEIIRQNAQAAVSIEGFTDSIGTADANLGLSRARAESVKRWLIEVERVPGAGFVARGLGATRFVAPNTKKDGSDDPDGRQKNRRVEIVIQRKS